jgi:hypothetical protein
LGSSVGSGGGSVGSGGGSVGSGGGSVGAGGTSVGGGVAAGAHPAIKIATNTVSKTDTLMYFIFFSS